MIPPGYLPVFFAICGAVNLVVFCVYAYDKYQARHNGWRTSEFVLLALALAGPFGAFAAMILFHHKTRKIRFYLVPIFLCIQLALMGYFIACP
ncbi:DUF1294 domain-containing protein [uncultured Methanoregula sp.]|uniref:DUF1294 domain-containing protein n=1 Tax=uncultured Methanoregula sp. TaxID=1005933 RepID=UPI002AABA6E1|nr:DUF1294 domain-containing protein [uncultured Methanoregula sp.]